MTSPSATRAAVRAGDAPFVFGLGLVGVGIALRVVWGVRGGALVLLAPPAVVAALVAVGTVRVWSDLRAAAESDLALAAFEGRESECPRGLVRSAKNVVDRAASTLPSICILIGLLGTFAGLFEALVGARDLLDSAVDAASLRSIVGAPLSGLARAFGSSAAGIVGSIVLAAVEGRFQGAADAVAVRIESIEERLRATAIGEEVRSAVTASDAVARERSERDARFEALLERVAKAVEAHAVSHASYNQTVVGEIDRLGSRVDRLQFAAEATHAGVRDAGAAAIAASAAIDASSREAGSAQLTLAIKIDAALRELAAASDLSASTLARVEEATRAVAPAVASATERAVAQASVAHREALGSLADVQEATRVALAETQRVHEERAAALIASSEARVHEGSAALAEATGALREHLAHVEASLAEAEGSLATKLGASLADALTAWSRRDEERAAREDADRRARWDDDDARRAEWGGAEKLVLQGAMDLVAERLAVVAEVHAKVLGVVEAVVSAQAELRRASDAAGADEARRIDAAGDRMRASLDGGAERFAETLARHSGALVEALRGELGGATRTFEERIVALGATAAEVDQASGARVAALEEHARSVATSAADVARAVETLAEVVRIVPLDAPAADGGTQAAAAPATGPTASDEDRALFVACLEEARRWFDATQALQQRLLDEVSQARGVGTRP